MPGCRRRYWAAGGVGRGDWSAAADGGYGCSRDQASDGNFARHAGELGADDRGEGVPGGEPAGGTGTGDEDVCGTFEGEDGTEAYWAGSGRGGDGNGG